MAALTETREILFHVRCTDTPEEVRAITAGKFNMAVCEVESGAIYATFIPETDSVADIMAALPHGRFYTPEPDAAQHVGKDAAFAARH